MGRMYLLITLAAQKDLRCSVLKCAHTKRCAASPTKCALNNATEPNICNLGQVLSGIEQDVLGLEIHVYQLHSECMREDLMSKQQQASSHGQLSQGNIVQWTATRWARPETFL